MKTTIFPSAFLLLGGSLAAAIPARADTPIIDVDAAQVVNHVTPWMTGACIEDVNHEIYGGLYDQKIFGESFEEPPQTAQFAGWMAFGGGWQRDGNGTGCTVDAQAGAKLVRDHLSFADGTVDVDVKMPAGGGNAGLLLRVRNPGVGADAFDGYEISLSADGRQIILGKHRQNFQPLTNAPVNAAPGAWHHLRVVLAGPRIQVFLDGAASPALDFTDPDPLPAGRVALRNWLTAASFRDIRVQTSAIAAALPLASAPSYAVSGMWDAIVTGGVAAEFRQDATEPFNGRYSQMIRHGAGGGRVGVANRGLNRWGIAVKRGQTFAGRVYLRGQGLRGQGLPGQGLRGQGLPGPVTVALQSADGRMTYAAERLTGIGAGWKRFPFLLTSSRTDPDARFAVWIDQPGTVWADQAVLMGTGAERFHGLPVRADIADAMAAEGLTFLRYGGTMVNVAGYRWKNMIGDPDKRPPYSGNWYPYSTNGFGIFDFLNFCEAAQIQAAFAINIEETAQDCADLADYLTAPVTNPWGRRRAEDGHPAPYRVHDIEIGNEESLRGDDPAAYRHYAERFLAIARAIHGRNPNLNVVCAAWWRPDSPNVEQVFRAIDGQAAAWDLHVWADDARSGADTGRALAQMRDRFHFWDPDTTMKAVIFEENGNRHDMQRALGHATTLSATQAEGDFIQVDCAANCLQPWRQNDNGWDQGQVFFTPDHVWGMPPYYAQQMASRAYEPLRVASAVTGSDALFVAASRSRDARTLVLEVTNTSGAPEAAVVTLTSFGNIKPLATAMTLAGALDAVNPPSGPPVVTSADAFIRVAGSGWTETFPAHSFTVVKVTR